MAQCFTRYYLYTTESMLDFAAIDFETANQARSSVCSVGLDMIAIPGNTPASTISAIIADEAAIGMINNKTTAVRVIPVPGKKVGDEEEWGGLLGRCPIMPVRDAFRSEAFIARGGRIPAPTRALTN